ncbi:MAG: TetR/AcrR family transcriptional regulator [Gammaproteobacteria bacterium]
MNTPHETEPHAKRDTILAAAQNAFLRDGYDAANMESIAQEAAVSKQTIYNHFGSKEDLFRAIVEARCENLSVALDHEFLDQGDDPERVLSAFGETVLEAMLSRENMRMHRLLQNEGRRYPRLAEIFYRQGPDSAANRLAKYLAEQTTKGRLAVKDPRIAAEQFVTMLSGHLRLRHLIGLADPPTPDKRKQYVANAVHLFLNGARPRT